MSVGRGDKDGGMGQKPRRQQNREELLNVISQQHCNNTQFQVLELTFFIKVKAESSSFSQALINKHKLAKCINSVLW